MIESMDHPYDIVHLPTLIAETFGASRSEARRLIAQGAVVVDGVVADDLDARRDDFGDEVVLRVGNRRRAVVQLGSVKPGNDK